MPDEQFRSALDEVELSLMGARPTLNRIQVAERADVPLQIATELWHQLGFPEHSDQDIAFTEADVTALRLAADLMRLGVLPPDSQAALVRTWGRSFARLSEWQTSLLAEVAVASDDPQGLTDLSEQVVPRIERLQSYVWRRHLLSAANRLIAVGEPGTAATPMAVCFIDIVGYTSNSKNMGQHELVDWIEYFEDEVTKVVVDRGGRVIKTIGDEVLHVGEDPVGMADAALELTARGEDEADRFPRVRAGLAYGDVVSRLGDVFGRTVNVAARLTSLARPGSVLVDRGLRDALSPEEAEEAYRFRQLRRTSVKGFARLESWALKPG